MNTETSLTGRTYAPKMICHFHGKDHRTSCGPDGGAADVRGIFCTQHWRDLWTQWLFSEPNRPRDPGLFNAMIYLILRTDEHCIVPDDLSEMGVPGAWRHAGVLNALDFLDRVDRFPSAWRLKARGSFAAALRELDAGNSAPIIWYADNFHAEWLQLTGRTS